MTAVLTYMSGMDPHMIRETRIEMVGMLGVGPLVFRSNCYSGLYGRFDVTLQGKEIRIIVSHSSFWHRMQPALSMSQT
jgi:G:T-mismatch repair DNA endonuclease (very short patch repair protein)